VGPPVFTSALIGRYRSPKMPGCGRAYEKCRAKLISLLGGPDGPSVNFALPADIGTHVSNDSPADQPGHPPSTWCWRQRTQRRDASSICWNRPRGTMTRPSVYRKQLDLETLVATRGPNFPLSRLESRLMCPSCGSRRVTVVFEPPTNRQVRRRGD
jgi:hypothetical protein